MPPTKSFYRIREVAAMLDVPTSTLRYWESEFPMLRPQRTESGQRRYTNDDYNLCVRIRELLYDRGMKIEAVREHLFLTYRKYAPRNPFKCRNAEEALKLLNEAKSFIFDEHGKKRIEAVEGWITQIDGSRRIWYGPPFIPITILPIELSPRMNENFTLNSLSFNRFSHKK